MNTEQVQHITWNDQHIATIIRRDFMPPETTFISSDSYYRQPGYVVCPNNAVVAKFCIESLNLTISVVSPKPTICDCYKSINESGF